MELSRSSRSLTNKGSYRRRHGDNGSYRVQATTQATDLPEIATILFHGGNKVLDQVVGIGKQTWIKQARRYRNFICDLTSMCCYSGRTQNSCQALLNLRNMVEDEDEDKTRLQLLWKRSFFSAIFSKASRDTGETNVWRHNFALAPKTASWLYHLQITAEDAVRDKWWDL
jgi:L-lactate utilization protein LutB